MSNDSDKNLDDLEEDTLNASNGAGDETTNDSEEESVAVSLEVELEKAQAKSDENWEKLLRLQAEMDNLRRRHSKQLDIAHKYAVQKFVESLLPVADSLEMGMVAKGNVEDIREGMSLTLKVLLDAMKMHHVEVVSPEEEVFNPDFHQAVTMQPDDTKENNEILSVMQKGYTLNGRLIRPAMVVVCKND